MQSRWRRRQLAHGLDRRGGAPRSARRDLERRRRRHRLSRPGGMVAQRHEPRRLWSRARLSTIERRYAGARSATSILPAWRARRRNASWTMSSAASRSSTNRRASRTSDRPSVWNSRPPVLGLDGDLLAVGTGVSDRRRQHRRRRRGGRRPRSRTPSRRPEGVPHHLEPVRRRQRPTVRQTNEIAIRVTSRS